jgi:hypothetical protein
MTEKYYLKTCNKCGIIDSSFCFRSGNNEHKKCPKIDYEPDKNNIWKCSRHLNDNLNKIGTVENIKQLYFCIDFINRHPNINSGSTIGAINKINKLLN